MTASIDLLNLPTTQQQYFQVSPNFFFYLVLTFSFSLATLSCEYSVFLLSLDLCMDMMEYRAIPI